MAKQSGSEWYDRVIKKGSKNIEEELKLCREMVEILHACKVKNSKCLI